MNKSLFSIRHKVIIGVGAVYLFMAATIMGSYYFMRQLELKVSILEDVSKLEESVLEVRRFEKNYFLYHDSQSLRTVDYHLARVKQLLDKNVEIIQTLTSKADTDGFRRDLGEYERLIAECSDLANRDLCFATPEARSQREADIRKTGTRIAAFAKEVAQRKRTSIKGILRTTVKLLILGLAVVGLGLGAAGGFLFTKVMRPLKLLEESTNKIARGEFEPIENLPPEREIRDMYNSFNRMAIRLKEREGQLVQSKKLASLGTMLAGVAHEINNPLSNISSSCEILLEELDEADVEFQRTLLRKVLEQVEKARNIVLNLLEFSRSKDFSKESLPVKDLMDKTLMLLRGQIPSQVSVVTNVDDQLRVFVDRHRMEQVFVNLISNAFQAIEGEGEVKIRAVKLQDGMVKIRIRDTGRGIPEEQLAKIFDPFFTTKDVGHGTGLGLFITHDIIMRHQGTIQVESTPGEGTTFVVTLPSEEPKE